MCTVIGFLVYIISPIDLIPEMIFGAVGLIDDFFVFIGLFVFIAKSYYTFIGDLERRRFRNR